VRDGLADRDLARHFGEPQEFSSMLGVAVQPSQTASEFDEAGSLIDLDTKSELGRFNELPQGKS
jgi:hypothetical protein